MKKDLLSTVCTAAIIGLWCLRSIQPVSPLLAPHLYDLSLPEATIRASAPVDFDIALPEVVIKAAPAKTA